MRKTVREGVVVTLTVSTCLSCGLPGGAIDWPVARPEAEGLNPEGLRSLSAALAGRRTNALLVARRGNIVFEWYREGLDGNTLHALASVSKSVVGGMALLLALEDSLVRLDDTVAKWIGRWRGSSLRAAITLRQLATHSSGMEDAEQGGLPHDRLSGWKGAFWAGDPDPFTVALTMAPIAQPPGSAFRYSSPGYAALGYALTAAFHQRGSRDLREVLRQRVMRPLGVPNDAWTVGYRTTYELDGLRLVAPWGGGAASARALARLGQLLLQRGVWGEHRLFRADLLDTVLTSPPSSLRDAPAATSGWYSNARGAFADVPSDAFFAVGAGHQVLIVVPSLALVAVRLGRSLDGPDESTEFWESIHRHVLAPLFETVREPAAVPVVTDPARPSADGM